MVKNPNILTKFWQELKRRKVFKVVAMYAGSAFVIIQVIDILTATLGLPPWIMTLVVILLSTGFPIVAVLAWIFDFTPQGIKKTESLEELVGKETVITPTRRRLKASDIVIAVLAIAVIILAYREIFKRDTLERLRSSGERIAVAVMPFQNMTNDTTWNVWQKGIQDMLVTDLSNSPDELKVRQTEPTNTLIQSQGLTNYASMTPSLANTISKKLDANVFIYGSIKQAGTKMRVNAELIDTKTKEALKTFEIEDTAKEEKVFLIIDSLKKQVKNFLIISKLNIGMSPDVQYSEGTNSPDAYRLFLYGNAAIAKGDFRTGAKMFEGAVAKDSNFIVAAIFLSFRYSTIGRYDDAKQLCNKLYGKRDQVSLIYRIMLDWLHAVLFETPQEVVRCLKQYLEIDNQMPIVYYMLGEEHIFYLGQIDQGIAELEKCLYLYKKWNIKPFGFANYTSLGYGYHKTSQYRKERKLYKKAESDFGDVAYLRRRQAILELTEGDTVAANQYIEKFISIGKENSVSEASIMTGVADIYSDANIMDKAEEYYRQALLLEPEKSVRMNNLAWFLIDKDRNIDEGLKLIDKALEISPNNYYMVDTKGWGLYKKGKYKEALEFLQKADSLKPVYVHVIYLHLEATKKAVAGQKNN